MIIPQTNNRDVLLTFALAAKQLCISKRQFLRLVADDKIPVVRVSERSPRVKSRDLDAFIDSVTSRNTGGIQS